MIILSILATIFVITAISWAIVALAVEHDWKFIPEKVADWYFCNDSWGSCISVVVLGVTFVSFIVMGVLYQIIPKESMAISAIVICIGHIIFRIKTGV